MITKEQQKVIEEVMNGLYPIEGVIGHFHISQRMVFEKGAQEVLNNPRKYGLMHIPPKAPLDKLIDKIFK